jgi:hypothetical protein
LDLLTIRLPHRRLGSEHITKRPYFATLGR